MLPVPLSGKETLQFSPTGVNSLSYSKRVDHQALLAVVIQTPHWYPSLQWYYNECSVLDEPNTLWTHKTASGRIQRDRDESSWRVTNCNMFCTVVCALAMVASLEIKAPKKATRKQGPCSSKRVPSQCRLARSVEEYLSWHHHKNLLYMCQTHLIPHQPVVPAGLPCWCLLTWQASVMWWVYMHAMNACVPWMHGLHQQYSSQNSSALPANGFLPKCLFCGALAAGYRINATLRSVPFIR